MSYMGFINELTNHKKPYMRSLTGNPKTQTFKNREYLPSKIKPIILPHGMSVVADNHPLIPYYGNVLKYLLTGCQLYSCYCLIRITQT